MWIWIGALVILLLALTSDDAEDSLGRSVLGAFAFIALIITVLVMLGGC